MRNLIGSVKQENEDWVKGMFKGWDLSGIASSKFAASAPVVAAATMGREWWENGKQVLERLDMSKCGGSVLKIMSRYLRSECSQRRRLALRGLVVPSKDPSMARRMCSVSQSLLQLLGDEDREVVSMSLHVFTNVLQHKDILGARLPPALAPGGLQPPPGLGTGTKVLCPGLWGHLGVSAALQASRETLHCAAKFLNRRDLEQLLEKEHLWKFAEVLLAEDRSRAAEHLRRARPYLQSPQGPLREAAVRFMGEPGARAPSPPRRSSAPAPPAAPPAPSGPGATEPRLAWALLPPSGSRALGRQRAARARAEPCRATRPCGHRAGSAAGRELCRWAVTGSVFAGMAGRSSRGQQGELQLICNGE
ncbi:uncharacterized protein LOC128809947 [Vidua macroura]|uniref:uncharacterized protein LOC128809947 n=1 Tax=Vidua macroura TaxID=187451 RepID=UPI0023A7A889|nr:uncharacterized protein LOC128809947 [Vidua macroura]